MTQDTSLIEYPCDFPIKVMGVRHDALVSQLTALVLEHSPDFDPTTVEMRSSSQGNYLGLTFTVRATSREQLDALYLALTGHELVKVVL